MLQGHSVSTARHVDRPLNASATACILRTSFKQALNRIAEMVQEDVKERKLSKREQAKKLRSGRKSAAAVTET